jgi:metal-dependent amidase/aminoacylase/carboxypeptidase family protein
LIHEAENIADALAALRRAFHMDPELGNREYHTGARIEAALNG